MVGWDLTVQNARQCLDVKMVNVWIVQTLVFAMLVGKEHFVMNLIVGKLFSYKVFFMFWATFEVFKSKQQRRYGGP